MFQSSPAPRRGRYEGDLSKALALNLGKRGLNHPFALSQVSPAYARQGVSRKQNDPKTQTPSMPPRKLSPLSGGEPVQLLP